MTIKVKQQAKDRISIRCNTEQEIRFVLGLFADLKQNGRMQDKIIVKDMNGDEVIFEVPEQPQVVE